MAANRPTGSIRTRPNGSKQLIVYIGRDPVTKKHRYRYREFEGGERAAGRALANFVTELEGDKPGTRNSIAWLLEEYLRLLVAEGRAARTIQTYESYVKTWLRPQLGSISLDKLTAGDVRKLAATMKSKEMSVSTIRQAHAILRGALRFAEQNDWVTRNVAALAKPPTLEPTEVVAATPAEADALYRAAGKVGDDLPTAISLAAMTGARLGELCALRWSNIDYAVGVIHFYSSKTHQTGDVPLVPTLKARLDERATFQTERAERVGCPLVEDPFVLSFVAAGDRRPASSSYTHKFATVRDALGLSHLHFHTLRHAYVTELLAKGVDPLQVSKLVRHRDLTMIGRVYGHGTPEGFKKAGRAVESIFKPKGRKPPALNP